MLRNMFHCEYSWVIGKNWLCAVCLRWRTKYVLHIQCSRDLPTRMWSMIVHQNVLSEKIPDLPRLSERMPIPGMFERCVRLFPHKQILPIWTLHLLFTITLLLCPPHSSVAILLHVHKPHTSKIAHCIYFCKQGLQTAFLATNPSYCVVLMSVVYHINTVEPPNKGHYGANNLVPCREVVPISEVK